MTYIYATVSLKKLQTPIKGRGSGAIVGNRLTSSVNKKLQTPIQGTGGGAIVGNRLTCTINIGGTREGQ